MFNRVFILLESIYVSTGFSKKSISGFSIFIIVSNEAIYACGGFCFDALAHLLFKRVQFDRFKKIRYIYFLVEVIVGTIDLHGLFSFALFMMFIIRWIVHSIHFCIAETAYTQHNWNSYKKKTISISMIHKFNSTDTNMHVFYWQVIDWLVLSISLFCRFIHAYIWLILYVFTTQ